MISDRPTWRSHVYIRRAVNELGGEVPRGAESEPSIFFEGLVPKAKILRDGAVLYISDGIEIRILVFLNSPL